MDPEKHRLDGSPRSLGTDAFFTADRSPTAGTCTVNQIEVRPRGKEDPFTYETELVNGRRDNTGVPAASVALPVFRNRHVVDAFREENPLRHARMTAAKGGVIDASVAGWKHNVTYTCFFSLAARALSGTASEQPRLQVKLLFGTGSEYYRHGVCGAVEAAADPTLLIVITGIEPQYSIEFWNPADPATRRTFVANNRWGSGITTASIEKAITRRYGRLINYDITVCAAFSTGYLGLQGSIGNMPMPLFPLDRLERVVIFDCLYGSLRLALNRVKSTKGTVHIIAYVVTGGGNSFRDKPESFDKLELGGNPTWNYINVMGNIGFHAITSARLVSEARSSSARVLDPLPAAYETALSALVAKLPARNTTVSSEAIVRKVRGTVPAGTTALGSFAADPANAPAIRDFFKEVTTTRHCIGRAQLLGWPAPPGEEWHDMLLIEFAWEFLT
jgi:hypothetical protein